MLQWFQALMPKEDRFFGLFTAHAATLVQGAGALRSLLEGGDQVPHYCGLIMQREEEADAIAREVLMAVRRSFITPFDRSDIRGLTSSLDDSIDQMQKTAKAITLFEVAAFEQPMRVLGDIIVEAAALTQEAVGLLGDMRQSKDRLNTLTEAISQLESRSDTIYDDGMKALYRSTRPSDAMGFMIGSEIYSHLERVVDRFEDVSNHINGILLENL